MDVKNYLASEDNYVTGMYSPKKREFLAQEPKNLTAGGRLRRERLLRNWTIEDMSDFLDISPAYLGAIERGRRPVSTKFMRKLHEKLNISYDFLLNGEAVVAPTAAPTAALCMEENNFYSPHHNLNVLLNVCSEQELEACYHLVHTYLNESRKKI